MRIITATLTGKFWTNHVSLMLCYVDYSKERQTEVQEQLTRVILRLLAENSQLHYYQGLHDVVITLLLVTGEEISYSIMSVLVTHHIR